jgi:plastocyanin
MRARRRLPRPLLLLAAALLGAGVVVLPAVAVSEPVPTIEALNSEGAYGEQHHSWSPSQVTVSSGGVVTIKNPGSTVPHGVHWIGSTPTCSGVPGTAGQPVSGTSWTGSCTFSQSGTYTFECTVHRQEMTGTVFVNASGTTTMTTTTQPSSGTGSTPGTTTGTGQGGYMAPLTGAGAGSSVLAASASEAVKVAPRQRGKVVRGSAAISPAGTGGRLEVELLAAAATLASAGHSSQVRVGRLVHPNLHPGMVSFSVPLNARARAALRRHGHLALRVRLTVKAASGAATVIVRRVTVRR